MAVLSKFLDEIIRYSIISEFYTIVRQLFCKLSKSCTSYYSYLMLDRQAKWKYRYQIKFHLHGNVTFFWRVSKVCIRNFLGNDTFKLNFFRYPFYIFHNLSSTCILHFGFQFLKIFTEFKKLLIFFPTY